MLTNITFFVQHFHGYTSLFTYFIRLIRRRYKILTMVPNYKLITDERTDITGI